MRGEGRENKKCEEGKERRYRGKNTAKEEKKKKKKKNEGRGSK